jgi:hypothetical protein
MFKDNTRNVLYQDISKEFGTSWYVLIDQQEN